MQEVFDGHGRSLEFGFQFAPTSGHFTVRINAGVTCAYALDDDQQKALYTELHKKFAGLGDSCDVMERHKIALILMLTYLFPGKFGLRQRKNMVEGYIAQRRLEKQHPETMKKIKEHEARMNELQAQMKQLEDDMNFIGMHKAAFICDQSPEFLKLWDTAKGMQQEEE